MQKILGFLRLIISVMFDFGPLSDSGISRGRKAFGLLLNRLVGSDTTRSPTVLQEYNASL